MSQHHHHQPSSQHHHPSSPSSPSSLHPSSSPHHPSSSSLPSPSPSMQPIKRIKRQRRKLRGKYSGDCLSCSAKWSKCWYIASVDNKKEWEIRLNKNVRPCDDEVCFQCWDGKIRTSPKRKQIKVEPIEINPGPSFSPNLLLVQSSSSPLSSSLSSSPPTPLEPSLSLSSSSLSSSTHSFTSARAPDRRVDSYLDSDSDPDQFPPIPTEPSWKTTKLNTSSLKRPFVDEYEYLSSSGDVDGSPPNLPPISQIGNISQIGKTKTNFIPNEIDGDISVMQEEHEAVLILSTAFMTFPSNVIEFKTTVNIVNSAYIRMHSAQDIDSDSN